MGWEELKMEVMASLGFNIFTVLVLTVTELRTLNWKLNLKIRNNNVWSYGA
jgi:hypothetical protein